MIHVKLIKVLFGYDGFICWETQVMLNVQISRGMIHKDTSSNVLSEDDRPNEGG